MHQRDEVIQTKYKNEVIRNKSMQAYQHGTKHIWVVVDKLTTMEPYLSKRKLREYDNILMQNTILKTK